jgi:hypothetical protein
VCARGSIAQLHNFGPDKSKTFFVERPSISEECLTCEMIDFTRPKFHLSVVRQYDCETKKVDILGFSVQLGSIFFGIMGKSICKMYYILARGAF